MEVLLFFIYAVIVFLLAVMFGGTMIGYYFTKKKEFELSKLAAYGRLIKKHEIEKN